MFYVLQVYNNCELSVKEKIEKKISEGKLTTIKEVLVPYQNIISISEKGKRTELKKAYYPGYIYLDIENYNHSIYEELRKIPKVSKFVGEKIHPVAMLPAEIEKIRKTDLKTKKNTSPIYRVKFTANSKIEVVTKPFIGCKGFVISHNPEIKKVEVEINILGRPIKLNLNELDVNIIEE